MPGCLPRRATAIIAAVALAGCVATILMIIRADRVPTLSFLHRVDDPQLAVGELRVTIAESDGAVLVVYGADADAAPERCSMVWIYDVPLRPVPDTAPRQEHAGITWRPLWETTVEGPGGGQEIFTSCTFDSAAATGGNYFVGPSRLPADSPGDWQLAAAVTGSATLIFIAVATVVLTLRSSRRATADVR